MMSKPKSNIKLVSNIMLKSKYEKDRKGLIYVPWELLSKSDRDSRNILHLSQRQIDQCEKHLFYAKRIVDIVDE